MMTIAFLSICSSMTGVDLRMLSLDVDRYIGNHPYYTHYHMRHPDVLLVDLDAALQVATDYLLNHLIFLKDNVRQVFQQHAAACNDGVFSFSRFKKMLLQVAPHLSDSVVLTMFREALIRGTVGLIRMLFNYTVC